jgi:FkbM family methyltransferase
MNANYDVICCGADIRRLNKGTSDTILDSITSEDAIVLSPETACLGTPLLNSKFFNHRYLIENIGEFNTKFKIAADVDLLLRAALTNPRLAVLPFISYHYIEHAGSITINAAGNNGIQAARECLNVSELHLERKNISKKVIRILRAWRADKEISLIRKKEPTGIKFNAFLKINLIDFYFYFSYLVKRKLTPNWKRFIHRLNSLSQSQQDIWLLENIFKGKREGTFVEIGAYDGISYSNCALMEGAFGWNGISIEPNPEMYKKLCRSRIAHSLNVAIGSSEGVLPFRLAGMLSGLIENYDPEHADRVEREFGKDDENSIINVPVKDIGTILQEEKIDHIDYISIDVEGAEDIILENLVKIKIPIAALTLENNYQKKELTQKVKSMGLIKIFELEADEVFIAQGTISTWKIKYFQIKYKISIKRLFFKSIAPWLKKNLPHSVIDILKETRNKIGR